jgi:ATP-dependent helicase/DNAse subunit B
LDTFINNSKLLKNIVDEAMQMEANIANTNSYSTPQLIMRDVIADYTKKMFEFDKQNVPFAIYKIETDIVENFNFKTPLGNLDIYIGGRVDRIDIKEDVLRITDYKTGGTSKPIKSMVELFASSKNRNSYAFQALLYSIIIAKQNPQSRVIPLILYINKQLNQIDDIKITFGKEKLNDIRQIEQEFFNCLNEVISNIFALDKPFTQTENTDICMYCDFKQICRR